MRIIKQAERLGNVRIVASNQSFPPPATTPLETPDYPLYAQYPGIPPAGSTPVFAWAGGQIFARYVYVYIPPLTKYLRCAKWRFLLEVNLIQY